MNVLNKATTVAETKYVHDKLQGEIDVLADDIRTLPDGTKVASAGVAMRRVEKAVQNSPNLLHLQSLTQIVGSVTITTDENNNVTVNGTASSSGGRLTIFSNPLTLSAGTYTFRQVVTDADSQQFLGQLLCCINNVSDSTELARVGSRYATPATFTLDAETPVSVGFSVVANTVYNNIKFALMLNAGNSAVTFFPPNDVIAKDGIARDIVETCFQYREVCTEKLSAYRQKIGQYNVVKATYIPNDTPGGSANGQLIVLPNQPTPTQTAQIFSDANSNIYYRIIDKNSGADLYPWREINARYGEYKNTLTGKNWYACGDSFTQGDFTGTETPTIGGNGRYKNQKPTYPYWIGTRNNANVYTNFAVNGGTLAKRTDGSSGYEFCEHYQDIPSTADYITLYFGINDSYRGTLGTNSDTTTATFYGALDVILKYYTENYPNTKIGVIATNGGNTATIDGFIAATKEMAKKYGVPCLDMNSTDHMLIISSRNPDVSASAKQTALEKYRVAVDNNHPNSLCHKLQSYFIEQWLLSI